MGEPGLREEPQLHDVRPQLLTDRALLPVLEELQPYLSQRPLPLQSPAKVEDQAELPSSADARKLSVRGRIGCMGFSETSR